MKTFAKIILFITSYCPLLLCVIVRQVWGNKEYIHYSGWSFETFLIFVNRFGLSSIIGLTLILSFGGLYCLFHNIDENFENGNNVEITNVDNRNKDIISYVMTYIIPLLFKSYDNFSEDICLIIILFAIYPIYINSSMLIVNPTLSWKYSLYQVSFKKADKAFGGVLITNDRNLKSTDNYKIYELSEGIYYGR